MTAAPSSSSPPLCQGPDREPRKPRHTIPAGAIDCHCHVFADQTQYPLVAQRSYTPPLCTLDDYLRMSETLGITRMVQVNASTYGFDNAVTLDVISKLGQKRARGVAGVAPDVSENEIRKLHDGGMRGVRLSTMVRGYGGAELMGAIAKSIKPFGWHVQLHVDKVAEIAALEQQLLAHPTAIVFDHLGRVRGGEGANAPGFQALLRILMQRDDCWVKLSSFYRLSDAGAPDYDDMRPITQTLLAARPDRVVWGSNWPHPIWDGEMPNDGDLLDLVCAWAGDAVTLKRVLVDNPAQLYGFN
jgi:predicted TIM-barrel fold metal-dependent hydrolase